MKTVRLVRCQTLLPDGTPEQHEVDLLSLIKMEAYLASFVNCDRQLPPLEELNRVLSSGSGDDGHLALRWSPFAITGQEYLELARRLNIELLHANQRTKRATQE